MYLYEADVKLLLDRLNSDPEIAFIVPVGRPERNHKWIAVPYIEHLRDGSHMLWHVPSGPLPLIGPSGPESYTFIPDPWTGWTEQRPGADPTLPFFVSHPGTIQLELHRWETVYNSQGERRFPFDRSPDVVGMSCFGWIGNRYRPIGQAASPATEKWWNRLRHWVTKTATRIPRSGPIKGSELEIYAFPCAYKAIESGKARDDNPL